MPGFLFGRLTAATPAGKAVFDAVTAVAREPHWYVEGKVPDTLDGRFAVLATVTALVLVRLERNGAAGREASVSLTERFIEVMETEHRELGIGDPTLGKKVRKLVGSLARRTDLVQAAVAGGRDWVSVTGECLNMTEAPEETVGHSAAAIQQLWEGLGRLPLTEIKEGRLQ